MTHPPRFAMLRLAVLVALALRCGASDAVGLGPLRLQSALGQPLRATVQVLGGDAGNLAESCIRVVLKTPDGTEIVRPQFELRRARSASAELAISTNRTVDEPAVSLLVEITCTPTLHRDYQLLLDLRDGLPRVVATTDDERKQETVARNSGGMALDAGDGSARPRKRRARNRTGGGAVRSIAVDDLETMSPDDPVKAPAVRAKPAPSTRSVLRLTTTDSLQPDSLKAIGRQWTGLRLSQNLGIAADLSRPDSDELSAAKARFQAVLRGEDALVAARKELKALQAQARGAGAANRAQPGATPSTAASTPAATPVATAAQPPAGSTSVQPDRQDSAAATNLQSPAARQAAAGASRSALASTSMLLGLALLIAAGVAIAWRYLRGGSRSDVRASGKTTPWWLAAGDEASREAELLESARASVARKKSADRNAEFDASARIATQDKALERYVSHFVGRRDTATRAIDERIEPLGLAAVEEVTDGTRPAPAQQQAADPTRADDMAAEPGQFEDAPRELARNKLATFELVSDVMQEAEFWKMLNETQRAIDILENYCSSAASASPAPWLYLAGLYEDVGDDERHAQLCTRFRQIFNGRLHEANAGTPPGRESLEGYPHVLEKITALWSQDAVVPFLQGLLINDRDSPREGFYLPVYQEILLLIDVAMEREQAVA